MSAIHIAAEVGRLYLMKDGERVKVTATSARVVTGDGSERGWGQWARAWFEQNIEAVIE